MEDTRQLEFNNSCEDYEFIQIMNIICERCDKANIEWKRHDGEEYIGEKYEIKLPGGRKKRSIYIETFEDAQRIVNIEFEKYKIIDEYTGLYSYETKMIEVFIHSARRMVPTSSIKRYLLGKGDSSIVVKQFPEIGDLKIILGDSSDEINALCCANTRINSNSLTLRIENISVSNSDKVKELLEKISNSLFFQIELKFGITLMLMRESTNKKIISGFRKRPEDENLSFPHTIYDTEPMSLYWYGKSANGIPLLQYLAFYQVIEFYYPMYSEIDAKKAIASILKNPTFNPNSDLQIVRVINTAKLKLGKTSDNEKMQLKATLKECINIEQLRAFINQKQEIVEFLKSEKCKKISRLKINLNSVSDEEFLSSIINRIYDIRCKIVHTKSSQDLNEEEILLPFAKEINFIYSDIEILEYIAQQVIICNGHELNV